MSTTITIHQNATEEQVQKVVEELGELLSRFGVTDWKREGKTIVFERTVSSEEKGAFLMIPRVLGVAAE